MSALAGNLRHRVALLRRDPARDSLGGASGAWVSVASAWAAVAPDGTGSIAAGDALASAARWRVTLRARGDVAIGDRISWGTLTLVVRAIEHDPRLPDRMLLKAEEER